MSSAFLDSIPDKNEIWNILKHMRNTAAPGPDGLNAALYKAAWNWIGDDIVDLVRNFYRSGTFPSDLKKTYIVLIPKKVIVQLPKIFGL
jgi:hypothetical protein